MTTWMPVPVGERRLWLQRVSAKAHVNCFQLASTQGSLDGPWSDILFVFEPARPDILTAYFAKIHTEALDGNFNPLEDSASFSITQEEGHDLITLLKSQIDILEDAQKASEPIFQNIQKEEFSDLHINQEAIEYVEEYFFRQVQPHGDMNGNEISTILLFTKELPHHDDGIYSEIMQTLRDRTHYYERLSFQIMQFQNNELQNPYFRPQDYAPSRIYLDRNDIQSLIELFQRFLV